VNHPPQPGQPGWQQGGWGPPPPGYRPRRDRTGLAVALIVAVALVVGGVVAFAAVHDGGGGGKGGSGEAGTRVPGGPADDSGDGPTLRSASAGPADQPVTHLCAVTLADSIGTLVPHHDPPRDNSSAITGSVDDLCVVDQTSGAGGGYFRGLSVEVDKYVPYSGLRPPRDRARQTYEDVHQRNVANGKGQAAPGVGSGADVVTGPLSPDGSGRDVWVYAWKGAYYLQVHYSVAPTSRTAPELPVRQVQDDTTAFARTVFAKLHA
jgi:hypothetical protein